MKRVVDRSEVVGIVDTPKGPCELRASADANYDEETSRLRVDLEASLHTAVFQNSEEVGADWLPKNETVTESVGPDEAFDVAKEIFHRWVRKLRQAAPSLHSI